MQAPAFPRPSGWWPQIYIPKIPGVPSNFQYYPDDFGLDFEVSVDSPSAERARLEPAVFLLCAAHAAPTLLAGSGYPALVAAQDVGVTAEDGTKLHAWFLQPRGWSKALRAQRPVVLFFQENAGNMSYRLPFLRLLTRYLDCSVFALR